MPYNPAMLVYAQHPSSGQWPQNTQYPPYQQVPQQGQAPQQPVTYPQYPYTSMPQTPSQYYGPQPPTQMSPAGNQGSPVHPQYPQHAQPQPVQVAPLSSASPHPATPSVANAPHPQHPYNQGTPAVGGYRNPPLSTHNAQATSSIQAPAQASSAEPEEDDLSKLDVPDLPTCEGGDHECDIENWTRADK